MALASPSVGGVEPSGGVDDGFNGGPEISTAVWLVALAPWEACLELIRERGSVVERDVGGGGQAIQPMVSDKHNRHLVSLHADDIRATVSPVQLYHKAVGAWPPESQLRR